jgi:two-component system LytT family response regulator
MLRALLIDDEPDARADLRLSLGAHAAEVTLVGEAESLDEAEARLAQSDYDLVFLDVQLRGGTGFDLVPRVRSGARIVFVTGHDSFALRAFEVNALDYLLKPVAPDRLAAAVARAAAALAGPGRQGAGAPEADDGARVPLRLGDVVFLRTDTQGRFVSLGQISAIEADQNYSAACLADGSRLLVRRTMKSWEDLLPVPHFMRVHRTTIVNLGRVTRYERDREERTALYLEGLVEPVSATRKLWPELQERLGQLRRVV